MKYKVMGKVYQNDKIRLVYYGEFPEYSEAYDLKEYLENTAIWTDDEPLKPYLFYIEEIKSEGDKYFDEAMENEEQNDY